MQKKMTIEIRNETPAFNESFVSTIDLPALPLRLRDAEQRARLPNNPDQPPVIVVSSCPELPELIDCRLDSYAGIVGIHKLSLMHSSEQPRLLPKAQHRQRPLKNDEGVYCVIVTDYSICFLQTDVYSSDLPKLMPCTSSFLIRLIPRKTVSSVTESASMKPSIPSGIFCFNSFGREQDGGRDN